MALSVEGLSRAIISSTEGVSDPKLAISRFWDSVCRYFEANAEVEYSWKAALSSPPYTPDLVLKFNGNIKASGDLTLSYQSSAEGALQNMASQINSAVRLWAVKPPEGFNLSPIFIIPNVELGLSKAVDRLSAMNSISRDIINGIKHATSNVSGTHYNYVGSGTFISIK